ncbi:TIGR02646 family protein [Prosthecobacter debontii]|uniref:TIGR02646 family protein n=1 Tax=Prosthecobacter debontii TaxID=48467 RepID=A0A1T4YE65_9BACT|nr:HNH endonuclease [Prosthecobacter debontii]SKB00127.1 TIGR02646 family protein [Prosthecobacter debontii]
MHAWERPQEPDELKTQHPALTLAFAEEHQRTGKVPSCDWPQVKNENGEMETLQKMLSRSTCMHCSYCDSLMGYSSRDTIDHFLPKKHFPHLAYVWTNLYLCCDGCQRKGTKYDEEALRPDEAEYSFSRYFRYRRNGEMSVVATDENDRRRAEITLNVLDLNDVELVRDRAAEFRKHLVPRARPLRPGLDSKTALARQEAQRPSYEDRPFRDFFAQDPALG